MKSHKQHAQNSCGTKYVSKLEKKDREDDVGHAEIEAVSDPYTNENNVGKLSVILESHSNLERDEKNDLGIIRNGCDTNNKTEEFDESFCELLENMNVESALPACNHKLAQKNIPLQGFLTINKEMSTSSRNVIPSECQCKHGYQSKGEQIDDDEKGDENTNNCTKHQWNTGNETLSKCNFKCEILNVSFPESSHCTNYVPAVLSQTPRQPLFFKSQSLDIGEDLSSISYIKHEDNIFSPLSSNTEIDNEIENQMTHRMDSKEICRDHNYITKKAEWALPTTLTQKTGVPIKAQSLESRPIYPNVPYSPYASPCSSPRVTRRRPPLRESRRISIEQSGSFLQLNQYKLMDQIGQGSYGLVKLAYSEEDSTHYAMKILSKRRLLRQAGLLKRGPKKGTSHLDRVYREIAVLKKLDHPNVVKLIEVLDDPMEDSLYMVFELVKNGAVLSIPTKNPLPIPRAWRVFRDTLLGLEYLHYQKIIHADIKPGNLLLTESGRVKIADLGVCNEFIGEDSMMTNYSTAGTPAFRAPETLNVGQNIYCGRAADVWALGATLYALVFGNVPFVAASIPVLYDKIKKKPLSFPENCELCPDLKNCIERMLNKNPKERITLPNLKVHPWVNANGSHPLPSEEENCRLVQIDDNDIISVVRSIPKLDTLILIKTMLKQHSFGNPFSRGVSGREPQNGGSRLDRFVRAGRSNSAPGSYNSDDRQISVDCVLPSLNEHTGASGTNEESQ